MNLTHNEFNQFLVKLKEKFPKKWMEKNGLAPRPISGKIIKLQIGKFDHKMRFNDEVLYGFAANDGQFLFSNWSYSKEDPKVYIGNICIKIKYMTLEAYYIYFENIHNLTIEEFYRKMMS